MIISAAQLRLRILPLVCRPDMKVAVDNNSHMCRFLWQKVQSGSQFSLLWKDFWMIYFNWDYKPWLLTLYWSHNGVHLWGNYEVSFSMQQCTWGSTEYHWHWLKETSALSTAWRFFSIQEISSSMWVGGLGVLLTTGWFSYWIVLVEENLYFYQKSASKPNDTLTSDLVTSPERKYVKGSSSSVKNHFKPAGIDEFFYVYFFLLS